MSRAVSCCMASGPGKGNAVNLAQNQFGARECGLARSQFSHCSNATRDTRVAVHHAPSCLNEIPCSAGSAAGHGDPAVARGGPFHGSAETVFIQHGAHPLRWLPGERVVGEQRQHRMCVLQQPLQQPAEPDRLVEARVLRACARRDQDGVSLQGGHSIARHGHLDYTAGTPSRRATRQAGSCAGRAPSRCWLPASPGIIQR